MIELDETFGQVLQIRGSGRGKWDQNREGKYNRNRMVYNTWLIGMKDIGNVNWMGIEIWRFRIEICSDNKRDANTVLKLLNRHAAPESTIIRYFCRVEEGSIAAGFRH